MSLFHVSAVVPTTHPVTRQAITYPQLLAGKQLAMLAGAEETF